ncbi:MAG: TldD/PmbA family protein, partial [Clostridia bacterium]|nr:TldD/PmbA family protein [Clostridia bacterium]
LIGDHTKNHGIYENSNGTVFETFDGAYIAEIEFAGNDGEKTTGLAYSGAKMGDLSKRIISLGTIAQLLENTEKSLSIASTGDKFEGDIIMLPDVIRYIADTLVENYLAGGVLMGGTSRWKDKAGQKVTSDKLTLKSQVQDARIVSNRVYTQDGYRAQNVTLIDKGILNSFTLSLYAANKTGIPVSKDGGIFVIEGGDSSLEEMIKSTKRGLILGGFSGGEPGANGEFSGVAKNSFYVENGEIKGAVMETMISGNLEDLFMNISAVSREVISDGYNAFPYIKTTGITISGS